MVVAEISGNGISAVSLSEPGTYVMFRRQGLSDSGDVDRGRRESDVGIRVTAPDGEAVVVSPASLQTATVRREVYSAVVQFSVASAGLYDIEIDDDLDRVAIGRDAGDKLRALAPLLLGSVVSACVLFTSVAALLVAVVWPASGRVVTADYGRINQ